MLQIYGMHKTNVNCSHILLGILLKEYLKKYLMKYLKKFVSCKDEVSIS